jgi:hypothetical protein
MKDRDCIKAISRIYLQQESWAEAKNTRAVEINRCAVENNRG